jgi:glycosyltransferase involved in cell wall biosynthesis
VPENPPASSGAVTGGTPHTISVAIPVYQGERTLPGLLEELAEHTSPRSTADGHPYVISEVLLVFDHGPDGSARTIRELARRWPFVRPVWLSRNFGQHAATLAGMTSSGGDWIVTMDEDGQHDPADIPRFLDTALRDGASLVYGQPTNAPPHGVVRNAASVTTKWLFSHVLARGSDLDTFQSFRLVLGEIGRSVAAYAGAGVFLDVALSWINPVTTMCPVHLREEGGRPSGYSTRRLLSHFWRLVLSSGTRGLRIVTVMGLVFGGVGTLLALALVVARLTDQIQVQGWTSVMVIMLLGTGAVLFSLGIVAEFLGVAVNMAMGRPLYVIVGDPADGPLGRHAHSGAQ